MSGKINKYVVGIVGSAVILTIGMVIGLVIARKGGVTGLNTYQAGWDAAKQRLAEGGFAAPMMNMEIKNVSGVVQRVQGDGMTVKIHQLEPLADPALDVRTVKFDANTKFFLLRQKDQSAYQKEIAEFNRTMQQASAQAGKSATLMTPGIPPQPFEKVAIKSSDIKEGMQASVTAANDIKNATEFIATEVEVQDMATAGALPAGMTPPMPAIPAPAAPAR